ncbi:hypothetical protein [Phenylobacterium sp.]|uniref:hypothetical protein n=1 Tax=Phenylobacterium sp. TaxID=1871053 RepID=UPI002FD9D795
MAALACLRVVVSTDLDALAPGVLDSLVEKFTLAFLEARWAWPRRFSTLNPYAFLLSDPRRAELDTVELGRLSTELHAHLFGEADTGGGAVTVLLFEGEDPAMAAFAEASAERLHQAMCDASAPLPGGQLCRLTPQGQRVFLPPRAPAGAGEEAEQGAQSAASGAVRLPNVEALQAIYYAPRQLFIGDLVTSTPGDLRTGYSLTDGASHLPQNTLAYDMDCVIAGLRFLAESPSPTPIFLPVAFSTLVRPSRCAAYGEMLNLLPESERGRLGAAVYDVPRAPSFQALRKMSRTLEGHFSLIDLRTRDPAFEIEQVGGAQINSVTFMLPEGEGAHRLAVLRRFTGRLRAYRRRRIWPAVTNIRTGPELAAARAAGVPFLTGPAISRAQDQVMGGRPWPSHQLPAGLERVSLRKAG